MRNTYRILVGKPEEERLLDISMLRWEDVIQMDLTEIYWVDVERIGLAEHRDCCRAVVFRVMNLRFP
jgi:hypothetical protein